MGEFRTRAVLAPSMLALIALIYWLDVSGALGTRQGVLSTCLLALLGFGGVIEYVQLLRGGGFAVANAPLLVVSIALFVSAFPFGWHQLDKELYPLVLATLLLLFPLAVRSLGREDMRVGLETQGATLLGFIFIAWPMYLAMGTCLRCLPSVLFVVLVCKGGDIGGYCTGRLFGRTKLIPHISPGKTVEGAAGSLLFSVVLAVLLRGPLLEPAVVLSLPAALGVGIVLNFTTQTGDLIESLLKRRCGAKDSSRLLPAHGGILDLVDSLLFSFCAWFLILVWLT
ncbi:MAG TPA: phosphatidate cytidylyltransferase [Planctomycetota bacterium]